MVRRPTAVKNFSDAEEVRRVYHPEVDRLIKELTGAETVLMFGPALRTDSPERGTMCGSPRLRRMSTTAKRWCAISCAILSARRKPNG